MKEMAHRPLVILPGGYYVKESDLRRVRLSHRIKQLIYLGIFVALVVLGSFDGGWGL